MENNCLDRDLICVLFPGIVKNDNRALECLGGVKSISQVYSEPSKKRLGLCFQPKNPYIKRIFADAKPNPGVLFKVKIKKTNSTDGVRREVVSTSVVGRVRTIFKFESMCDFQYLPVHNEGLSNNQPACFLEQLIPSGIDDFSFMTKPAPLYIVPSSYTRADKPNNYAYTDKRYPDKKGDVKDDDVYHRRRSDRGAPVTRFTFNLFDDLPAVPHEHYVKKKDERLKMYPESEQELETIKKLFEQRPIWSQNRLKYETKLKMTTLKICLPFVALYMKDGPWRMLWVRYGYDPRKDPAARIYQTLDFRLRHTAGVHSMVLSRDRFVHFKRADRVRHTARPSSKEPMEDVNEGAVCFRPGLVPTQRQIFYQYCDIQIPEVEEILAEEPPPGALCHQKRGWLASKTDEVCRDHVFKYVKQTLLSTHNADMKFEDESSDEDANSNEGAHSSSSSTE